MASSNENDPPVDMEGVRLWIARHGTESTSRWEQQWRDNVEMKKDLAEIREGLVKVNLRLSWIAGIVIGATFLANFLASFLSNSLKGA